MTSTPRGSGGGGAASTSAAPAPIPIRSLTGSDPPFLASGCATARDARHAYEKAHGGGRVKLYWKGAPVADATPASALNAGPDDFLVAVASSKQRRQRQASTPPPPAGPPPPSSASSPTALTSLLPGYASRPHGTPGRAAPAPLPVEDDAGFVRPTTRRRAAESHELPVVGAPPPPPRAPRRRKPAAPLPAPLPPALASLESAFTALGASHDFLVRQHILPTWKLVRSTAAASSLPITPAAARAAAALCPDLIALRPPAWRLAAARYRREAEIAAAAAAEVAGGGETPWAASPPGPPALAPAAAPPGTDEGGGGGGEDLTDEWVVDMSRPRTRQASGKSAGGGASSLPAPRTRAAAFRAAACRAATALETRLGGAAASPDGPWELAAAAGLDEFVRADADAAAPRPPPPPVASQPRRPAPPAGPAAILDALKAEPWYAGQAAAEVSLPARSAAHAAASTPLPPAALAAAAAAGVDPRVSGPGGLWRHQAAALDAAAAATSGRPLLVVTPTASGKSLCFTLPLVSALAADPAATALLLFPTKALAQDQLRSVNRALAAGGVPPPHGTPAVAAVYDGDVARPDRASVLSSSRVLLTNPDMLHRTILPGLASGDGGGGGSEGAPVPPGGGWRAFLSRLALVAVDEVHAYTGAFGSHTSLVLRRLWRACAASRAGTSMEGRALPLLIGASATVGNAAEHAGVLFGRGGDVTVIDEDGSPAGPRTFVVWKPPETVVGRGAPAPSPPTSRAARAAAVRAAAAAAEGGGGDGGADPSDSVLSEAERLAAARLGRKRAAGGGGGSARPPPPPRELPGPPPPPPPPPARPASPPRYLSRPGGEATAPNADEAALTAAARAAPPGPPPPYLPPPPPLPPPASASAPRALLRFGGDATAGLAGGRGGRATTGLVTDGDAPDLAAALAALDARAAAGGGAGSGSGSASRRTGRPTGGAAPPAPTAAATAPARAQPVVHTASPIVETGLLLAGCVRAGARTLAFCKTRKLAELVAAHARSALDAAESAAAAGGARPPPGRRLSDRVAAYRGGYEPGHRRAVEAGLFGGALLGVAATNALELGVDVGDLDVTLHLGVPGAAAALWQQAGRAGRRAHGALSIIIPFDGPLDRWWAARPAELLGRPVEAARCDPTTPCLLAAHVAAAAAECAPLSVSGDAAWFGGVEALRPAVDALRRAGVLAVLPGGGGGGSPTGEPDDDARLFYAGAAPVPAATFSLRAIDPDTFTVLLDEGHSADVDRRVLERVEASKAFFSLHDGGVWMHQGKTYLVKAVDVGSRTALVRRAEVAYYTKTRDATTVATGRGTAACAAGDHVRFGRALVTTRFYGFHRIWKASARVFDTVDLVGLPDVALDTRAAWVCLGGVVADVRSAVAAAGAPALGPALHAAAHALARAAPARLLCNADDLGTECDLGARGDAIPPHACRLLCYDRAPGGAAGLTPRLAAGFAGLAADALALVAACACAEDGGCPGCVQVATCSEYGGGLHKAGGVAVLEAAVRLLGGGG